MVATVPTCAIPRNGDASHLRVLAAQSLSSRQWPVGNAGRNLLSVQPYGLPAHLSFADKVLRRRLCLLVSR